MLFKEVIQTVKDSTEITIVENNISHVIKNAKDKEKYLLMYGNLKVISMEIHPYRKNSLIFYLN